MKREDLVFLKSLSWKDLNNPEQRLLLVEREAIRSYSKQKGSKEFPTTNFASPSLSKYLGLLMLLDQESRGNEDPGHLLLNKKDQFREDVTKEVQEIKGGSLRVLKIALFFSLFAPTFVIPNGVQDIYLGALNEPVQANSKLDLFFVKQGGGFRIIFTKVSYILQECSTLSMLQYRNINQYLEELIGDLKNFKGLQHEIQDGLVGACSQFTEWHGPHDLKRPEVSEIFFLDPAKTSFSFLGYLLKHKKYRQINQGIQFLEKLTIIYQNDNEFWTVFASRAAQLRCARKKLPRKEMLENYDAALELVNMKDSQEKIIVERRGCIELARLRFFVYEFNREKNKLSEEEMQIRLSEMLDAANVAEQHFRKGLRASPLDPNPYISLLGVYGALAKGVESYEKAKTISKRPLSTLVTTRLQNSTPKNLRKVYLKVDEALKEWPQILVEVIQIQKFRKSNSNNGRMAKTRRMVSKKQEELDEFIGNEFSHHTGPTISTARALFESISRKKKYPVEKVTFIVAVLSNHLGERNNMEYIDGQSVYSTDLHAWTISLSWLILHKSSQISKCEEGWNQAIVCKKKRNKNQTTPLMGNSPNLLNLLEAWARLEKEKKKPGCTGHRTMILYHLWQLVVQKKKGADLLVQKALENMGSYLGENNVRFSKRLDRYVMRHGDRAIPFCNFLEFSIAQKKNSKYCKQSEPILHFAQKIRALSNDKYEFYYEKYGEGAGLRQFEGTLRNGHITCSDLRSLKIAFEEDDIKKKKIKPDSQVKFYLALRERIDQSGLIARGIVPC